MIRIHRGRGGSVTRTAEVRRIAALVLVCFSLAVAGCSSKKTQGVEGLNNGVQPGTDLSSKSTLEDYSKNGSIGGQGGPLSDIHFGYNDYTIQAQDSSVLRSNASWLQAHPNTNVQVEGNCDDRGSEEYNIALGAKRAQSAKDYLTTLGISPNRISTISYGKELPICHEQEETCWQQNRRDHFAVTGGQATH
jgi:peptidoglycan-associated lipoprotein